MHGVIHTKIYPKADIDKLADISSETATNVVKTCLKLHKTLIDNSERLGRVHFDVGACHSTETGDILKAMQKADARMYAVKEDYYMRYSKCEWHN